MLLLLECYDIYRWLVPIQDMDGIRLAFNLLINAIISGDVFSHVDPLLLRREQREAIHFDQNLNSSA